MMALTVTWGAARTWSFEFPGTAAVAEFPVLAGVNRMTPATLKRALGIAEPFMVLGAEAAGAGFPELILVVAAVAVAKCMLSQHWPAGREATTTSLWSESSKPEVAQR
jgi:hypothetical protein